MKRICKEIKYWSQLLLLPLYGLSFLVPRNKKIWVFGSSFGLRFADNPKYFYLYVSGKKPEGIRAVWITKRKEVLSFIRENDMEAYYLYSLKGLWYSLRAKIYLYDNYSKDICYTLSGGAVKINLWHGIPLKKIQQDNMFDHFRNPRGLLEKLYAIPRRLSDEKPSNYVLSASQYYIDVFASAFRTQKVLVAGYPRNDILIDDNFKLVLSEADTKAVEKLQQIEGNRIVLYMPTFRDSETMFFEIMDLQNFCSFLESKEITFCVKLHPKSKLQAEFAKLDNKNLVVADPMGDPYPLCRMADLLVTDYSSIYFDYLMTGKPMVFFPYDYDEYLGSSRELYFDYEEFTPGIKVRNMEELKAALTGQDGYSAARQKLKKKLFTDNMDSGSKQLFEKVFDIINP